jgi:Reverse transcriptase (RNA-dependent DNA polymerase)
VRLLLALAAHLKKPVYQFDVKSAFLNGELAEEVYVEQPRGFEVKGKEEWVYKLVKALYGLKQAPRAWYSKIDAYFINSGFERSKSEPNLYVKKNRADGMLVVCLYVDDMIYMGTNEELVEQFRSSMKHQFEMSDLGMLHYFLGLEVEQESGSIFVSQRKYARDLLKKFGMHNCKPASTPMNVNEKLVKEDGTGSADGTKFRSLVGGLIYLTHTRPDISYAVGVISRYMQNPTKHHFGVAKRILKYISGTADYGLWYGSKNSFELVGYSDSDWAECVEDRRSTSGYVFSCGSSAISWSSKKQSTVALSSSEAEYVAVNSAACQVIWLRKILEDVGQEQQQPTQIYCDNQSAIAIAKNPVFHGRSKHIDIKLHFIRDLVAEKIVELKFVTSANQKADVLTKTLVLSTFETLRMKLGVTNFESRGSVEN